MCQDRKPFVFFLSFCVIALGIAVTYGRLKQQGRVPPLGDILRRPVGEFMGKTWPTAQPPSLSGKTTRSEPAPPNTTELKKDLPFRVSGALIPAPNHPKGAAGPERRLDSASSVNLLGMAAGKTQTQDALPWKEVSKSSEVKNDEDRVSEQSSDSESRKDQLQESKVTRARDDSIDRQRLVERAKSLIPNGDSYVKEGFDAPELIMGAELEDIDRLVQSGDGIVVGKLGNRDYRVSLECADGTILKARTFFVVRESTLRRVSNRRLELNNSPAARTAFAGLESRFLASVGPENHVEPVFVFYPSAALDAYIVRKQWGALHDAGFDKERVREITSRSVRIATRGRLVATSSRPLFLISEVLVGDDTIPWTDPEERLSQGDGLIFVDRRP